MYWAKRFGSSTYRMNSLPRSAALASFGTMIVFTATMYDALPPPGLSGHSTVAILLK